MMNQRKKEQKDVKNFLDRKATWDLLSKTDREFMLELKEKFNNIKFIYGVKL